MSLKQKLTSRKFLITLWAILIISFIVISGKEAFIPLAEILATIPFAYSGLNVWEKTKLNNIS